MTALKKLFKLYVNFHIWMLDGFKKIFGYDLKYIFLDYMTKSLVKSINGLRFDVSEDRLNFRVTHFGEQEPDLIHWIDDHYQKDEVFYDVGANIGFFSLYAAQHKKVQVLAFEPESLTYATLNKNIFLNQIKTVKALNICLDDKDSLSFLNLKCFLSGNAYNTFEDELTFRGEKFSPQYKQGCLGITLDHFIELFQPPFPNHIKIDVDGNEDKIIRGMSKTLLDPRLKTITVELTAAMDRHGQAIQDIQRAGFIVTEESKYQVQSRDQAGTKNFHFIRKTAVAAQAIQYTN